MILLRLGVSWKRTEHKPHRLMWCLGLGPAASVQCEGQGKGAAAKMGRHTFPFFHQMWCPYSVHSDAPTLWPCPWLCNPAHLQESRNSFFSKHIAHAYCEPQGGIKLWRRQGNMWLLLFFRASWTLSACLRGNIMVLWAVSCASGCWQGGWGGFTASGEISRAYFSQLILAFLEVEILH